MISLKKFIPGIAWFFLVLFLICLPGDDLPKGDSWMNVIFFDKWVHAGLFFVLAYLFMRPIALAPQPKARKKPGLFIILASAVVWGILCEFIQKYFVPGRSFDLYDWAADSIGAGLAFIFWRYRLANSDRRLLKA